MVWVFVFFARWERSGCGVWHLPSLSELQTAHQTARSQHEVRLMCLKYVNAAVLMSRRRFPQSFVHLLWKRLVRNCKQKSPGYMQHSHKTTAASKSLGHDKHAKCFLFLHLNKLNYLKKKQTMECVIIKSGSDETRINGCSLQTPTLHHHRPSSPLCTRRPF